MSRVFRSGEINGERWKTISEFPEYMVSDYGRIRNTWSGRVMETKQSSIAFYVNGVKTYRQLSRVVYGTFYGFDKIDGKYVRHKNGDTKDNRLDNLYLSETMQEVRKKNSLSVYLPGIGQEFRSIRECARAIGVSPAAISKALSKGNGRAIVNGFEMKLSDS